MSLDLLKGICTSEFSAVSRLSTQSSPSALREVVKRGASGDLTKMIDKVAEDAAVLYLESSGFRGGLLSEELGFRQFGGEDYPLVVLDPVDGTTNATRGIALYSFSIALARGPRLSDVESAVVMEIPSRRIFWAERGAGAFLDGSPIMANHGTAISQSLAGVDFNVRGNPQKVYDVLPVLLSVKHIRNLGSAALGLCYTACDALDFYLDNRCLLRVTDIAASVLILREAGAKVLDLDGNDLDCSLNLKERVGLVAGAEKTCREALSMMRRSVVGQR
ncbi:MAG: D-fructose 1,6-bisphosphatase [Candidatus Methanosuratus sp.]|nr:D-fructose 1,6-bisphosphatase [Candidatus Methanosuratincola sp.]